MENDLILPKIDRLFAVNGPGHLKCCGGISTWNAPFSE